MKMDKFFFQSLRFQKKSYLLLFYREKYAHSYAVSQALGTILKGNPFIEKVLFEVLSPAYM